MIQHAQPPRPRRHPQLDPLVVVGYARTSTDEQHLSPAAQRRAMEVWCRARGARLVEVHRDTVTSVAPLEQRPGLTAALASLREDGAGTFLVARRDRLGRDVVLVGLLTRMVEREGAVVQSADGVGDAPGAEGALLRSIVDCFAQYERHLIRVRTSAALQAKKAKGELVGSCPWGRKLHRDGRRLVPEPRECEIIEIAQRLNRRGRTLREIAAELERRSFRTRAGRTSWWPGQVQALLRAAC